MVSAAARTSSRVLHAPASTCFRRAGGVWNTSLGKFCIPMTALFACCFLARPLFMRVSRGLVGFQRVFHLHWCGLLWGLVFRLVYLGFWVVFCVLLLAWPDQRDGDFNGRWQLILASLASGPQSLPVGGPACSGDNDVLMYSRQCHVLSLFFLGPLPLALDDTEGNKFGDSQAGRSFFV
ncbi:MAG TPA: hypothetical protein DDX06_17280 [Curvibacter sp.]|nr:hypothetical protein [Curvibacter sp.]